MNAKKKKKLNRGKQGIIASHTIKTFPFDNHKENGIGYSHYYISVPKHQGKKRVLDISIVSDYYITRINSIINMLILQITHISVNKFTMLEETWSRQEISIFECKMEEKRRQINRMWPTRKIPTIILIMF